MLVLYPRIRYPEPTVLSTYANKSMTPKTYVARQDGTHGRYRMCRNRSGTQAGSRPIAGHQEPGSGGSGRREGRKGWGVDEKKEKANTSMLQEQHFLGEQRPITMIRYSGRSAFPFPCHLVDFSRLCFGGALISCG